MNWFREGVFAPVTEEVTVFDLPVTGRIPSELNGRYLRNGSNFMRGLDDSRHHWFLGSGMVHGVRLREGRAEWYRNRWVRSKAVSEALGEQWQEGPIHAHDFAANTHILAHAGRILATVEGGALPYEFSDLTGLFGLLALTLASVGLYGITTYSVARRINEIGVRMALGANRSNVVSLVMNHALLLVGIGLAIGIQVALLGGRLMRTQLYGVKIYDPGTLAAAVVVLSAFAALAGFIPARRAASIEPMQALRIE